MLRQLVWTLVQSELQESDEEKLHENFLRAFQKLSSSGRGTVPRSDDLILQHLEGHGDKHPLRFQSLRSRLRHPASRSVLALLFNLRSERGSERLRKEPKVVKSKEAFEKVSEVKVVRDLLFALQGVNSDSFEELDPKVVLSRPRFLLSKRILELAKLHRKLTLDTKGAMDKGLLHQALCEALRKQLQGYYEVLSQLMSSEGLSLRDLWARLLAPMTRVRFLCQLSEGSRGAFGGALSSVVFAFSHSGDLLKQDVAREILRSVVKPLWSMIRAWITEGELQDPFGEFFVVADASVPLEDLWTRMYSLELEMVPSFISLDLARKILLTGKSVNFIRLCCGRAWSPEPLGQNLLPDEEIGAAEFGGRVERAALQTNEHLVKLLMEHYLLGEHALALRRFLLLGQGDFVETLMDALQEETEKLHKHQLMGMLETALRQSNAQFCSPDILGRLGVKLRSERSSWDAFLLDYRIDSPLHVVFTPSAMQRYERAFSFLWKLRRVAHALAASWTQHMALQRHLVCREIELEMRQTLHRCTCLRNEMHHFVQNVQSYVLEVLDSAWAKLQTGWQKSTDLDQVISLHEDYLANVEEGAFLAKGSEGILTGVTALLSLALEFCAVQDQACASSFEVAEADEMESLFVRKPYARSLAECRASLDHLASTFQLKLQLFLRALEDQPERHSDDLSFLLCRLDFNTYYEQKRAR